mmetsp:Transcript_26412/g.30534  ORF Transcript_26412/g.30534 Transcript_26412/m.30534 type:complete len:317 (+) Transcript_26412:1495-2445(+)
MFIFTLNELSTEIISGFNSGFCHTAVKNLILSLIYKGGYPNNIYVISRIIEMRDSILMLMEMYSNPENKVSGSDLIFNKELVSAYFDLVSIMFVHEEAHPPNESMWFSSMKVNNDFKLYKYLYNNRILKHAFESSKQDVEQGYSKGNWNSQFVKYMFFTNESRFSHEHVVKLRNKIFVAINNMYKCLESQDDSHKLLELKQAFEAEIEKLDLDDDIFSDSKQEVDEEPLAGELEEEAFQEESKPQAKPKSKAGKSEYTANRKLKDALVHLHTNLDLLFDIANTTLNCNLASKAKIMSAVDNIIDVTATLNEIPGLD